MVKCFNTLYIFLRDFNEVRCDKERLGTNFCIRGAKLFNDFIEKSELIDLPMGGRNFTRMNKYDTKLSKIDRILVSQHLTTLWPNSTLTALPRELSGHCPLILKTLSTDYGPIPFKFFNSWLLNRDFHNVVTHGWSTTDSAHFLLSQLNSPDHPVINLKRKLQHLKSQIHAWRKGELTKNEHLIDSLKQKINVLEEKAENGSLDDQDMADRLSHLKTLEDLEHLKNLYLKQKAKVNWAIEGDENSNSVGNEVPPCVPNREVRRSNPNLHWVEIYISDAMWHHYGGDTWRPDPLTCHVAATSVAAGQSEAATWRRRRHSNHCCRYQVRHGGVAANHCTRWLANRRMPRGQRDEYGRLARRIPRLLETVNDWLSGTRGSKWLAKNVYYRWQNAYE
ncbi:cytochrome P450 [Tanacetum coccineum]